MHDTIGLDLVGMVVDDIVVAGAEPLFMTDYIACGKVVPERIAAIVAGHRAGLRRRRLRARRRRDRRAPRPARPRRVRRRRRGHRRGRGRRRARRRPGARRRRGRRHGVVRPALQRLLAGAARARRRRLGRSTGTSTSSAAPSARSCSSRPGSTPPTSSTCCGPDATDDLDVHALSHVTGGGLAANLARVLPRGVEAVVDRCTWTPAPIFGLVRRLGRVPFGRPGTDPQPRASAWSRSSRRTRPTPPSLGCAARGLPAWVLGEVAGARRARPGRRRHAGREGRRRRRGADDRAPAALTRMRAASAGMGAVRVVARWQPPRRHPSPHTRTDESAPEQAGPGQLAGELSGASAQRSPDAQRADPSSSSWSEDSEAAWGRTPSMRDVP